MHHDAWYRSFAGRLNVCPIPAYGDQWYKLRYSKQVFFFTDSFIPFKHASAFRRVILSERSRNAAVATNLYVWKESRSSSFSTCCTRMQKKTTPHWRKYLDVTAINQVLNLDSHAWDFIFRRCLLDFTRVISNFWRQPSQLIRHYKLRPVM